MQEYNQRGSKMSYEERLQLLKEAREREKEREQIMKKRQRYKDEFRGIEEESLKVKDSDMIKLHIDRALDDKDEELFNVLTIQLKGALYREKHREEHLRTRRL